MKNIKEGLIIREKHEYCPNCEASMAEYIYHFDCLDALLLVKMAEEVRGRLIKGLDFTVANQVHTPSLPTYLSVQCRTTQCSKLGLTAKVRKENGKHAGGMWLITARGWAALKGEPVPKLVKVWRGRIEERFDELITIGEAFKLHREKVEAAIMRHKNPKTDFRKEIEDYQANDWYEIAGYHDGKLL